MKTAIYVRVSTQDQSLDSQLHALREYATKRGFEIVQEFSDLGISGAKESRPGLNDLMAAVRKREVDAVLVFRFDRFARSTKHLALALDEFRALGVQFMSFSENIDTATPMGQAMFTMISAMAQLERDIIINRVRAGMEAAKAKGVKMGRPGISEKISREIREKRDLGLSIRDIAKDLRMGATTVHRALGKYA